MSEPRPSAPPATPRRDRRRYGRWLALIAALVIGVVIGGIIVAVFGSGDHITVRQATVLPPKSTAGPSVSSPSGATLQLNADCLRALNDAQSGYNALSGFAAAVRSLDAGALDNIVRKVQQAQRGLSRDLRSCHAIAVLPNGSTTPVPLPSGSPTH